MHGSARQQEAAQSDVCALPPSMQCFAFRTLADHFAAHRLPPLLGGVALPQFASGGRRGGGSSGDAILRIAVRTVQCCTVSLVVVRCLCCVCVSAALCLSSLLFSAESQTAPQLPPLLSLLRANIATTHATTACIYSALRCAACHCAPSDRLPASLCLLLLFPPLAAARSFGCRPRQRMLQLIGKHSRGSVQNMLFACSRRACTRHDDEMRC